ncbi:MAG: ImmA/IrrE family metallo-endopeptidase [Rhodocyclaceae bacterium]|nr:ImmA/IrrE family metallo-endopeptidase [Rhodocyclaceae bacterium]
MIEREAQRILANHWDGKLPVDVHAIASRMGLEVRSGALEESGRIELIGELPRITVNANEAWVRQRFTVAHELGHWALGHLRHGQRLFRDAPASFTLAAGGQEREANAFAAAILMPADALRFVMQEGVAETLEGLARMFDVSQAAMHWRVHNLGLFSAL